MRMDLCHSGDVRQWDLTPGDQVVPSGRLRVPRIDLPKDTEQEVLYADIDGSPFSRNPGRVSLAEAEEESRAPARTDAPRRSERGAAPAPAPEKK